MKNIIWLIVLVLISLCGNSVEAQSDGSLTSGEEVTMIMPGHAAKVSVTPGQTSEFDFTGKAGEYASLVIEHSTYRLNGCSLCIAPSITISGPDGRLIGAQLSAAAASLQGQFMNAVQLPVSGKYRISFASQNNGAGTVDATVFLFASEIGTLTPGIPTTVSVKFPGQYAGLSFHGMAGQQVSFTLQNSTFASCDSCNALTARIVPLVGSAVVWTKISGKGTESSTSSASLPASGRYTLVIAPQGGRTGNVDVTLSLN